jgi:hypothetical protein
MPILVKILGIVIIGIVFIVLIRIDTLKRLLNFVLEQTTMIYVIGVIRIIIGSFLLLAASQCKIPVIILVIGLILLASGILVFLIGTERAKKMLGWMLAQTPVMQRVWVTAALIIGALMVYAA